MFGRLRSWEEKLYYYYSLVHIPITVLIDSSVVVPEKFQLLPGLVRFHVEQNHDYLLYEKPAVLRCFVWLELIVQLPLFVYFAWEFRQLWSLRGQDKKLAKDGVVSDVGSQIESRTRRLYRLLYLYGVNAASTTLWCIYMVCMHGYYPATGEPLSTPDLVNLVFVYLPTFIIPARLIFLKY
ncbi:putative membrane protein [Nakaseomyces bracarensis]|uniref:Efficient mitochondria targeting-associated protein 19 n=1 Tax=Nakaseomyces bracarensis TaxID=273131 RepID=A0ABR4NLN1_9SACH